MDPDNQGAVRSPWWTSRTAAWSGVLVVAAIALQASLDVYRGHSEATENIHRDLQAQARVIAEQTARGIQAVDIALANLADRLASDPTLLESEEPLRSLLQRQAAVLEQTDGLVVFDAAGDLVATSLTEKAFLPPTNVAKRPIFARLQQDTASRLDIDNVARSPATLDLAFPMGRRISDANGHFLGVVGARGRVEYFQHFYRESFGQQLIRITLMHREGWLLARNPSAGDMLGKRMEVLETLLPRNDQMQATVDRLPSPVDGADHYVALQLVPGYPLVIAVSREALSALAEWRAQAFATLLRTGVLCALAALLLRITLRQLNELHAAKSSLQISDERYAIAMEGSQGGHWVYDTQSDLLYSSEAVNRLFGLSPQARTMPRLAYYALLPIHPEDRPKLIANSDAVIQGSAPRLEEEYRILLPDQERWIMTRAQRFKTSRGEAIRIAGVSVDITDRKKGEAEREQLAEELRKAQRLEAIGTLAGGIAHDFNNILATILGHGELALRRLAPDDTARPHIETCQRAGERAKALVERILAFARGANARRSAVNVKKVVLDVVEQIQLRLPDGVGVDLTLEEAGYIVFGDPIQIHQVVLNLCTNAIQAMNDEGRLLITLEHAETCEPRRCATGAIKPGNYLSLQIVDEGVGIDPQTLERVFDPFFTTRGAGVGTGLGLSLVHGIVSELGGGVEVASEEGKGTRFTVYFPAIQAHEAEPVPADSLGSDAPFGAGQVVLVVDDEPTIVSVSEEALAQHGYEPVGCTDPAEALALFSSEPQRFDLVMTDESMPAMRGTELARRVRELRADIPILLVSGFMSPGMADAAKAAGVNRILDKPVPVQRLGKVVAAVLAEAEHAKANA